jgi:hypothetical protein
VRPGVDGLSTLLEAPVRPLAVRSRLGAEGDLTSNHWNQ